MTATLEKLEGLECRLDVVIPGGDLKNKIAEKTEDYRSKARLPGFRANKSIPASVITKRFGSAIREESQSELMQKALEDAIKAHDLKLASSPEVGEVSKQDDDSVTFSVTFEQYPTIELVQLDTLSVERPLASLEDAKVDEAIAEVIKRFRDWHVVEEPVAEGHRLLIDFSAVDEEGSPMPGIGTEGYEVVMGETELLEDFERPLMGKMAGDTVEFPLTFPKDYVAEELQGKTVNFTVTIHEVQQSEAITLDEDFFKKINVEATDEASFREEVRAMLQKDLDERLREALKRQVAQVLREAHPIEVPEAMIKEEMQRLFESDYEDHAKFKAGDIERMSKLAKQRAHFFLLMDALMAERQLEVDQARLDAYIRDQALSFMDDDTFVDWVYSDEAQLNEMRAAVLEEQLYDAIIDEMQIQDKTISVEELDEQLQSD